MGKKKVFSVLTSLIFLVGCFQEPAHDSFVEKKAITGVRTSDLDLEIDESKIKSVGVYDEARVYRSSELFEYSEAVMELARIYNLPVLEGEAHRLIKSFYQSGSVAQTSFRDGPYMEAAIANTKSMVVGEMNRMDQFVVTQKEIVLRNLHRVADSFPPPKDEQSLYETLDMIQLFLRWFLLELKMSDLDRSVYFAVKSRIESNYFAQLKNAEELGKSLGETENFSESVKLAKEIVSSLGLQLDPEQQGELKNAERLSFKLDHANGAKNLFKVVVDFWDSMDPASRDLYFGELSPELHRFLSKKSRKKIDCLKDNGCRGLITRFINKAFIYPKLKKYGLSKLKNDLNESAAGFLSEEMNSVARGFMSELPVMIETEVVGEFSRYTSIFSEFRQDYGEQIKSRAQVWLNDHFDGQGVYSFESSMVWVRPVRANEIEVKPLQTEDNQMVFDPSGVGTANSALIKALGSSLIKGLADDEKFVEKIFLSKLNQVLAIGGFNKVDGIPYPALMRPIVGSLNSPEQNMEDIEAIESVMALPDKNIIKSTELIGNGSAKDISVIHQAKLLNGAAALMEGLRDWGYQGIPYPLSKFKSHDWISDFPPEFLQEEVFPKDVFYMAALGNAMMIINNLRVNKAPILVKCDDKNLIWKDSGKECKSSTALAGLVDIKDGKRSTIVRSADTSEYILALVRLLRAIEGMSESSSVRLLQSEGATMSVKDQIETVKPQLRQLLVGLSNMLSNQLQKPRSLFWDEVDLSKDQRGQKKRVAPVKVQAKAMEALVSASEFLGIRLYKWSAVEAFYQLNRSMFVPELGFYKTFRNGKGQLYSIDIAITLKSLQVLKPELPVGSRNQLDELTKIWISKLSI